MPLQPGVRLGAYEILSALGAGGMGEVYRARDTNLKREVAIKVLPEGFSQDPDRLARFQREAELLATLNHPNIAQIYGLERQEGRDGQEREATSFIVMELVEGETLAEVIMKGSGLGAQGSRVEEPSALSPQPSRGLALDEALAIARQVADALEAAHEKGVVHRDLKPANIKITPDGKVKVLDFGLAKLAGPAEAGHYRNGDEDVRSVRLQADLTHSPTITTPAMMTGVGMVLGTAAYMSPEQARGRAVDKRTDVWAFGCVLFEMLSGARAFDGEDVAETIGAVIHKEPAWAVLPATTPATVRTVLQRCLQKDPKQRIRDIGDVQLALGGAFESGAQFPVALPMVAAPPPKRSRVAVATAALMVTAGVATIVTLAVMRSAPTAKLQSVRFAIAPPAPQSVTAGFDAGLAISPDGSRVVYVSGSGPQRQLMVRAIDKLTAVPLRGTTGARFPFFSPDSRWVGFFTNLELRKAPLDGSSPVTLCRTAGPPSGASWGPDDTIVFSTGNIDGLLSVPATGGEPQVIAKPDLAKGETTYEARTVLPEGTVVFTILTAGNDKPRVVALNRKTGQRKTLVKGADRTFFYADTGQLLFGEGSDVRAVRFDLPSIEVVGEPVTVLEQVTTTRGRTHFGISRAGSLVYMTGGASSAGDDGSTQRSLVWVDRQGREQPLPAPRRPYAYPRLSPDGTRVAVDIRDQDRDIWIWDLARQSLRRLTFDPKEDLYPVWTPDGQRIVFSSTRAGAPNLFWQPADGTGSAERLTTGSNPQLAYAMSSLRDVLFREDKAGSGNDLHVLHLEGRRTESVVHLGFGENNADLSPDGRWLAYQSGESGQLEVYVRPFPRVDDGRWQISTGGGGKPVWTRNGRELCFLSNLLVACAAVQTTPTFSAGAPSTVLKARYWNFQAGRTFDVSADGQRFLMVKDESTDDPTASQGNLVVVLNWVEELKTRLPAR